MTHPHHSRLQACEEIGVGTSFPTTGQRKLRLAVIKRADRVVSDGGIVGTVQQVPMVAGKNGKPVAAQKIGVTLTAESGAHFCGLCASAVILNKLYRIGAGDAEDSTIRRRPPRLMDARRRGHDGPEESSFGDPA